MAFQIEVILINGVMGLVLVVKQWITDARIVSWIPRQSNLGSLTNNFCPANFEKIILQRALKCFNYYKI